MDTQTNPRQGSHHWVMTLAIPGRLSSTMHGTITPRSGATRQDTFEELREELTRQDASLERANVMFFALEPNQL